MSESKHTPGPWEAQYSRFKDEWSVRHPKTRDKYSYIEICERSEHREADARLIAAAPDLLEALTRVLSEVDGTLGHLIKLHNPDLVTDCRAAIAKATTP